MSTTPAGWPPVSELLAAPVVADSPAALLDADEVVATLTLGLTGDEFSVLLKALDRAYGPGLYVRAGDDPATVTILRRATT